VLCSLGEFYQTGVFHLYASGYSTPQYLSPSSPSLGVLYTATSINEKRYNCTFRRDNANPAANYYNLNANPTAYVIAAHGTLTGNSQIGSIFQNLFLLRKSG
jgi:hypothetical protein